MPAFELSEDIIKAQKEYNEFVDSMELGDLHITDIQLESMNLTRDWIKKLDANVHKLKCKWTKVYEAYTLQLEKYVESKGG